MDNRLIIGLLFAGAAVFFFKDAVNSGANASAQKYPPASLERGRELLPANFNPSMMTSTQRGQMRSHLQQELKKVQHFISNPPVVR